MVSSILLICDGLFVSSARRLASTSMVSRDRDAAPSAAEVDEIEHQQLRQLGGGDIGER